MDGYVINPSEKGKLQKSLHKTQNTKHTNTRNTIEELYNMH